MQKEEEENRIGVKRKALIIGIGSYEANHLPPLEFCEMLIR